MKAVNLLSSALLNEKKPLPELPREPVTAICAVTGQEALCLPRKDVIGKAFTDISVMAAPSSQFVSLDVFYAWNYGYKTDPSKKMEKNSSSSTRTAYLVLLNNPFTHFIKDREI